MQSIFWISIGLIVYTYAIYPLTVIVIARYVNRTRTALTGEPRVSVVVCARNEGSRIVERLRNLCAEDYRPLQIVVVSDGSTDETVTRIRNFSEEDSFATQDVDLLVIDKDAPAGKPAGLNDAVEACDGEILVFADARQRFGASDSDRSTIRRLIDQLGDSRVGCVSGELSFVEESPNALQSSLGAYWRYEKLVRKSEAIIDSVPGVTGAIYAMRRNLWEPVPDAALLDDVVIPLRLILRGYRVTFEERAVARDTASTEPQTEWRRKVRTLAGNWQLLELVPSAFVPFFNRIWLQFISHKVLRLLCPFALLTALLSAAVAPGPLYRTLFAGQLLCYGCAVSAVFVPTIRRVRLIGLAHTFVILNAAAAAGLWFWISGQSSKTWTR